MSEITSRGQAVTQQQEEGAAPSGAAYAARRRGQGRRVAAVVVGIAVLAAGAAEVADAAGAFRSHDSPGSGQGGPPPATAAVVRRDLSSQTALNATLEYAGSYTVQGQGSGTLTWLPSAGQVIRQGHVLYKVDTATRWCCCTGRCRPGETCIRG
jgi:hypothetical protein